MTSTTISRRERILRTAEKMFADHGFEAVGMREIASAAEVSVALLTYHFETKENLYQSIFAERQSVLEARIEQLRAIPEHAPNRLELIIDAFVDEQMRIRATPDGLAFARLLAREATDLSAETRTILSGQYDPFAREFIAELSKERPDLDPEVIPWHYLFAVGAISMSALDKRVSRLGGDPDIPVAEKSAILKSFLLAAFRKDPSN
ncbi:TetR/AcrR family transcriptional regulator [Leucobacter sp. UT-8R-CII-1-4]|uniref:TetR/AcrR family transcriptional regulator n=1 Tax=Leucobacter sp. UT-8R-CII-1-4 TaxID=3040075 RepID=UPI0024A9DF71|nr:TetR/AcrR family transcriptional regulator [Leucobacter sp. UT-8R-CII-1-4]MDI6022356.1 TetR/AcrR family transcriptional regulator [Leucobacter sp. UT-8R-CII-1-4]